MGRGWGRGHCSSTAVKGGMSFSNGGIEERFCGGEGSLPFGMGELGHRA